jgi:iron uptake system component EfeO
MLRRIARATVVTAVGSATLVGLASGAHAADPPKVKVTISDKGCPAKLSTKAGATTFVVTNKGKGGVTEFEVVSTTANAILGEVENIDPGKKAEFTISLKAGDYKTACPGGTETTLGDLTVTGTADTTLSADGQTAVDRYRQYLIAQTAELTAATTAFTAAVDAGDLAQAKELYAPSRIAYERIEPVAEAFGDLDPKIDAREGDVPKKDWGGYHYIEKQLWIDGTTDGLTEYTADLNTNVQTLENLVKDVELQPAGVANGAVELLNEVSKSKITGEEERYSRTDLVDFEANVQGAEAAYDAVKPMLEKKNPQLVTELDAKFAAVYAALQPYKTGTTTYVAYTDLAKADTRKLSQAIDSLAEPLSKVSKQVVGS